MNASSFTPLLVLVLVAPAAAGCGASLDGILDFSSPTTEQTPSSQLVPRFAIDVGADGVAQVSAELRTSEPSGEGSSVALASWHRLRARGGREATWLGRNDDAPLAELASVFVYEGKLATPVAVGDVLAVDFLRGDLTADQRARGFVDVEGSTARVPAPFAFTEADAKVAFEGSATVKWAPLAAGPVEIVLEDSSGRREVQSFASDQGRFVVGAAWTGRDVVSSASRQLRVTVRQCQAGVVAAGFAPKGTMRACQTRSTDLTVGL